MTRHGDDVCRDEETPLRIRQGHPIFVVLSMNSDRVRTLPGLLDMVVDHYEAEQWYVGPVLGQPQGRASAPKRWSASMSQVGLGRARIVLDAWRHARLR
jgi:hypothetical protein